MVGFKQLSLANWLLVHKICQAHSLCYVYVLICTRGLPFIFYWFGDWGPFTLWESNLHLHTLALSLPDNGAFKLSESSSWFMEWPGSVSIDPWTISAVLVYFVFSFGSTWGSMLEGVDKKAWGEVGGMMGRGMTHEDGEVVGVGNVRYVTLLSSGLDRKC